MSILCCGCMCGSTDSRIRNFLKHAGYPGWASIKITKGKEKSRALLNALPRTPEVQALDNFLKESSKWAVIIGWDANGCAWSDIAHNATKSRIEAEYLVKRFAE